MVEPWFNPIMGGILGGAMGILGAITCTVGNMLAQKGKAKKLVLGIKLFAFALSFSLIVIGIVAYLAGQPRSIWLIFGNIGLICAVIFGIGFVVFLKTYTDAELRKSMSEDLTLKGNNDRKQG